MKNQALEVLKNRRSIRKFKTEQIPGDVLDIVLEAGMFAPTAAGTQAPIVVAVQDPNTIAKLDAMNAKILNNEQMRHPYYGAPTVLIILTPKDALLPFIDGSLVGGNLMNAAYAVGLGSCWIHRTTEMFETDEGKELLKKWGFADDMIGVASILLGYPDCDHPKAAARKDGRIVKI